MKNKSTPQWVTYAPQSTIPLPNISSEIEQFNLYEVALDVFSDFVLEARNKKILLTLETDSNWTEAQTVDPHFELKNYRYDVHMMLSQLVKNALAQTLEGTIKINISTFEDQFIVEVNDTGLGIDPNNKISSVETEYRGKLCKITYIQDPNTNLETVASSLSKSGAQLELMRDEGNGMKRRLILPKTHQDLSKRTKKRELALV